MFYNVTVVISFPASLKFQELFHTAHAAVMHGPVNFTETETEVCPTRYTWCLHSIHWLRVADTYRGSTSTWWILYVYLRFLYL